MKRLRGALLALTFIAVFLVLFGGRAAAIPDPPFGDDEDTTPSANGSSAGRVVLQKSSDGAAPQRKVAPRPPAAPGTPWDDDAT